MIFIILMMKKMMAIDTGNGMHSGRMMATKTNDIDGNNSSNNDQ